MSRRSRSEGLEGNERIERSCSLHFLRSLVMPFSRHGLSFGDFYNLDYRIK